MTINNTRLVSATLFSILFFALSIGCSDEGCKSSADCQAGYMCKSGKCTKIENDTESDTSPDSEEPSNESDSEITQNTDRDASDPENTDESSDANDSDSEDSDSDPGDCSATALNGEFCNDDCNCVSGHCEGGICCEDGECCKIANDCENDLCQNAACRGGNYCEYMPSVYACGESDLDGQHTCTGTNACNGAGACLPIETNCGAYAVNAQGSFNCLDDRIQATCYTDCTPFNAIVQCAPNALCLNEQCVLSPDALLKNGSSCNNNSECETGNCNNGFCCAAGGNCCSTATDCSDSCRTAVCSSENTCITTVLRPCGSEDSVGNSTCEEDHRCDGQGNCIAVSSECIPYVGDGTFECIEGSSITENCLSSCSLERHCQDNFSCDETGACVVENSLENGEACNADIVCESGHCQNGFCCEGGDCCNNPNDCGDLCGDKTCVDNMCVTDSPNSCGSIDASGGDTCSNNGRCDGVGNCITLSTCSGPYKATGQYNCEPGIHVEQQCYTSCNNDTQCNAGYRCDTQTSTCTRVDYANNGEVCSEDADCKSGHCGNGFCCEDGDCCNDADDCLQGRCVFEICSAGDCHSSQFIPCGHPDEAGSFSQCSGGALCDGQGGCDTSVSKCNGAYAWTGEYSCSSGSVAQSCYESCFSDIECNLGYGCVNGYCVKKLENGEGPCSANSGCVSNHCNTNTGICCDAGMCCADNTDCGGEICDVSTHACELACDLGSGDDDSVCAALGSYHCDNGLCESDLEDGEYLCNEMNDCASGYCDTSVLGICCDDDSAPCCVSDNQCDDGQACIEHQCVLDCSPNGNPDHSLCRVGYHCDGDICKQDIDDGAIGCDNNIDCGIDSRCENHVCCSNDQKGQCCRADGACDDNNPCTDDVCLPSFHCAHLPMPSGTTCDENGVFCDGVDTCDTAGICQNGTPPCAELNICQSDAVCDENTRSCIPGTPKPDAIGMVCSEPLFCLNGREKVCNEHGQCVDPSPEAGTPCNLNGNNVCITHHCDETTQSCVSMPLADGTLCNDGDPCTGENTCQDGVCAPAPKPPCDDDNPCTTDECSVEDGKPICGQHHPIDGEACNDRFSCFGSASICQEGTCVPGNDACKDDMGICTISHCEEQYFGKVDCSERELNEPTVLNCGTSATFDATIFTTREYYTYNTTCSGSYPGKEAAVGIMSPASGSITITTSNISPSMNVSLALLGDWCNKATCKAISQNSITFDAASGLNVIVLEAMENNPPDQITLTVGDCPQ